MKKILLGLAVSAVFLLSATVSAFCILCIQGCQKEEHGSTPTHSVTYTTYGSHAGYKFGHTESTLSAGTSETINSQAHSVTLQVSEDVFDNDQGLTSTAAYPVDSLYIQAEYDGKKVSRGFKSTGGIFTIGIKLSEAK